MRRCPHTPVPSPDVDLLRRQSRTDFCRALMKEGDARAPTRPVIWGGYLESERPQSSDQFVAERVGVVRNAVDADLQEIGDQRIQRIDRREVQISGFETPSAATEGVTFEPVVGECDVNREPTNRRRFGR